MLSTRLSLVAAFALAVTLVLILRNSESYSYTSIQIQDVFPNISFRPPSPFDQSPPLFPLDGHHQRPEGVHAGPIGESDASAEYLLWSARAVSVKEAFLHAYDGYERYAPFPADELLPLTNKSIINFNGWGVTMVDALDTMLLMGLEDQFQRAISQVAMINFTMPARSHAPFFETIIRYLGGFLSAYALSKEPILLSRADELATRLLPAFNTTKGLPKYGINTQTKELSGGPTMFFSEIASCQMEYKYLAHLTGREEYFTKVERIMDALYETQHEEYGMWSCHFDVLSATPLYSQYSVGALADSGYEYLLKQYLMSGKTEHRLAEMYMKSMTGILENLVFLSHTRNLLYITDTNGLIPSRKFEHLSCFFPGLLALGAATLPESVMSPTQKELHMWAAEGLAHTCWVMYADQPSGLGAEIVLFEPWQPYGGPVPPAEDAWKEERWMVHLAKWELDGRPGGKPPGVGDAGMPVKDAGEEKLDYQIWSSSYLLRPETLESMFVMYRVTRDVKWRERGWQIWEAVAAKTRTPAGFASVQGVDKVQPEPAESMPSYFLAETVKYAYLLALDEDPWPMETYILNTEAHPLPVFSWRDWERQRYGVVEPQPQLPQTDMEPVPESVPMEGDF